ncbi:MAG: DUF262 domain-containing protein [Aquificota bacterium]
MGQVISETREIQFIKIFNDPETVLLVPNYQRPYSWTEKEVEDFLQDIYSAYKNKIPYLLGSIFLAPVSNIEVLKKFSPNKVFERYFASLQDLSDFLNKELSLIKPLFIVDGQQRITTFALFLKALGKYRGLELDSEKLFPRLLLSDIDNDFFQQLIEDKNPQPQTLSQRRLEKAYEIIKNFVEKLRLNDKDFEKYYKNKLNVIRADVADIKYAVMLFISQTDRGKPLSYIDRLKGLFEFYVYYKFPENLREEYSQRIDELFEKIYKLEDILLEKKVFKNEDDFETLLYRVLTLLDYYDRQDYLRNKYKESLEFNKIRSIPLKKAYERIVYILRNAEKPEKEIEHYLTLLENFAKVLQRILKNINNNNYKRTFIIFQPGQVSYTFLTKFISLYPQIEWDEKKFSWNRLYGENSEVFKKLKEEFEELSKKVNSQEKIPSLISKKLEELKETLKSLENKLKEEEKISLLDFIEKMDYAIWKSGKKPISRFKRAWDSAFMGEKQSPNAVINAFNEIVSDYLNTYLFSKEVSKFILIEWEVIKDKNEKFYDCVINRNFTVEHIFPQNPDWEINNYGFTSIDEYNDFIEKLGNKLLLRGSKNSELTNARPCQKAPQYIRRGQDRECYPVSTYKVGEDLQNLCQIVENKPSPLLKIYLELRDLFLKAFTIERFI